VKVMDVGIRVGSEFGVEFRFAELNGLSAIRAKMSLAWVAERAARRRARQFAAPECFTRSVAGPIRGALAPASRSVAAAARMGKTPHFQQISGR
jgi:hypothetical protein